MNLKNCKGLFLDIHGVLFNSSNSGKHEVINGSIDSIQRLTNSKFPFLLVTNESQISPESLLEKLKELGFNVSLNKLQTPVMAINDVIKMDQLKPYTIISNELNPIIKSYPINECNSVIIADAVDNFSYQHLNEAFQILMNKPEARFISAGKGKYYFDPKDGLKLDSGVFATALEYASGRTAEIVGKPSKIYYESALKKLNLSPNEVIMIGDDIVSDVGGAQKVGMQGVLVRSGKYRPSDENHPDVKPNLVVNNLQEFIDKHLLLN